MFLGTGSFGVPALEGLIDSGDIELVGIVSAPARPSGRRRELRPSPAARAAGDRPGVAVLLSPDRLRAPEAIAAVLALEPDIAILADYGQLVPGRILDLPLGALNLHPSLLPRHRGATPIPAAILAGDERTGVSLFKMDAGLDTGRVIAQVEVELSGAESAPDLEEILSLRADTLLRASLGPWIRGELPAVPQDEARATLTRPLRRDDGRLDAGRPAADLERAVRAYRPWPGTFLETDGGRLAVLSAVVGPSRPGDLPGRLVGDEDGLALGTVDGRLRLLEVQPAGGRAMSGAAFVRGRGRGLIERPAAGRA